MPRKRKSTMTVGAMIRALNNLCESGQATESTILEIATSDVSVGTSSGVGIDCVYPGFDWDNGRLFISPVDPLVKES